MMLYSVIIPAYNCEAYIDEALGSVLCRLRDGCEVIVVDDGSDDGTRERLKSYESLKNVTVLCNGHQGVSAARNAGLRAARGEYISFLDCDDRLKSLPFLDNPDYLSADADLYIFGIERVFLDGGRESWTVPDRVFPTASDFADAYIREHRFLIYSNGNKLYRKRIIDGLGLRFDEDVRFGEDRLFNYGYLMGCGKIVTDSATIYEYLQRSLFSMSGRAIPGYFDIAMKLHKAKMDCFLSLSKGCSEAERSAFVAYDLGREIEQAKARYSQHPEEARESMAAIHHLGFDELISRRP